jgi:hypothetical protein
MQASFHTWALIVARLLAGAFGSLAFYMAFFLYEDEEGHWQNRIDRFWVAVDDRARQTDSKTIATLNKLAGLVQTTLNRPFGEQLISLRAVVGSMTVSVSTAAFLYFSIGGGFSPDQEVITGVYSLIFGSCAIFPFVFPNTVTRVVCFLPPVVLLILVSRSAVNLYNSKMIIQHPQLYVSVAWFFALFLSILTDFGVVYAIRRKFSQIVTLSTTLRMVVAIAYLVNVCLAASGIPYCVYLLTPHNPSDYLRMTPHVILNLFAESLSSSLFVLNICSLVYALAPCAVLCFLVLHRTFWPGVARLVYAVRRNRILTNKQFLIIAGVLSFALAFNFGKETVDALKDLLKGLA